MKRILPFRAIIWPVIFISSLTLLSCQRSGAYKRDQEYYRSDLADTQPVADGYYSSNAQGKNLHPSATRRLEMAVQPKKRIMVINFWNDTLVKSGELGGFAAQELRRELYLSQKMLLPADARGDDSQTEDFVNTGSGSKVKVAQLVREGRRLGVAIVVIGRISKIVFRQKDEEVGVFRQKQSLVAADVEIKAFDVTAGREIVSISKSGEDYTNVMAIVEPSNMESPEYRAEIIKFALRNAVQQATPELVRAIEKTAWEGKIAKIHGNKIYLNAGRASGLVGGDILRVITTGEDIFDPTTGAFLGRTQGQMKGTLEVTGFLGADSALTHVHTGGNFQEGDLVQLY